MKKLIVGLLIAAIVSCLSLPLISGYFYHAGFEQSVSQARYWLRTNGLTQIQIDVKPVQWGWLSSDYEVDVFWRGKAEKVNIHNEVRHGPLPYLTSLLDPAFTFRPTLANVTSTVDFSQMGLPFLMPSLSINQEIDMVGNVDAYWRFVGYINDGQDSRLDAASSSGELHFFTAENRVAGNAKVPDLRAKHKTNKLQVSALNVTYEFTKIQEAVVPVGTLTAELELGRWQSQGMDHRVKHADIAFHVTDFEQENNFQLKLVSDGVQINDVQLQNNDWDVILRGIGAAGIDAIIPTAKVSSFSDYINEVVYRVDAFLPQVLSGTELEVIHFESVHETGEIRGFLRTNVPPLENVQAMTTEALMGEMKVLSEVSLPKPLVHTVLDNGLGVEKFNLSEKYRFLKKRTRKSVLDELAGQAVEQQIRVIVASGLVTEADGNYFSSLELNEGDISFNGHIVHGF